jgi:hypothetical protein
MFGSWLYCSMYYLSSQKPPPRIQYSIERPCYLRKPISIHGHVEAHHLVDAVALPWGKAIESFGNHAGVVLEECIRVLLQVLNPLTPLLEGSQLPAGRVAGFLKGREFGAQLVKRDESLGLLILVGATLTIQFGKLIRPHCGL